MMRKEEIADGIDEAAKNFRNGHARHAPEPPLQGKKPPGPHVMDVAELLTLDVPAPKMLIETLVPLPGACLIVGAPKGGKTVLAVQMAVSVASGHALFDNYRVLERGPAMVVEQDDPAGAASIQTLLKASQVSVNRLPFFLVARVPFTFGPQFIEWLGSQITARGLRFVVLDSYTALRPSRGSGMDIVKTEQHDLTLLDDLAKRTSSTIAVLHHDSKGSFGMDWTDRAAGSFAMSAATEAQLHVSRFPDFDSTAPERLLRMRGRHCEGLEMVLKFRKPTLDYEHVLDGPAAPLYPVVIELRATFGTQTFSPKEFYQSTGQSRATAHRQLARLQFAGILKKRGTGEYQLSEVK
jgi:hypothetical protein